MDVRPNDGRFCRDYKSYVENISNVNINCFSDASFIILYTYLARAEDYNNFLSYTFKETFKAEVHDVHKIAKSKTLTGKGGIYVLYLKNKIPFYVGYTKSFGSRMAQHIIKGGKVHKITNNKWPIGKEDFSKNTITVLLAEMDIPSAKMYESLLLKTFDFALNKQGNEGERPTQFTKAHSIEEGSVFFKKEFVHSTKSIMEMEKMLSLIENYADEKKIRRYDLKY